MSRARLHKPRSGRDDRLERRRRRVCAAEHWLHWPPMLTVDPFRKPYDQLARVAFVRVRCGRCRKSLVVPVVVDELEVLQCNPDRLAGIIEGRLASAGRWILERLSTRAKRQRWLECLYLVLPPIEERRERVYPK